MMKFSAREHAIEDAKRTGRLYGWSVLSPGWYVGTMEELKIIAVLDPVRPT